ncbi:MAG: D-glycero-D-manno-heptose 1-phosphate guanosyltransferase [uncultured bacterium (gcode 4)]|uniref:D-glycero-D-manno-heptose 1-phosphate guanosyltransferase n=1 Tax=uncultured bacterium (gcode 4) TaxID=1234023 RepID=K2AWY8_9BACT|nr:MAG: D-glycero-D-manno-heptose 1-phosphate guanosyltransferase [uncultured bacterium (gcode 4)]
MQVVILAWWLGTRLRPITESIPKPMVEINSKPFLYYQLQMIKKYWFKDILLLVWYLWEKVEIYFWNWDEFWLNIKYNYEKELLWTWWALKLAQNKLEKDFILIYGDSYLDFDYNLLIDFWIKNNYNLALTAYNNQENTDVLNNLEVKNWKVLQYKKWIKDKKLNYVEAWVLFVKKEILNNIEDNKIISLEEAIFPKLIADKKLWAYIVNEKFYDIWTFERLNIFKNLS